MLLAGYCALTRVGVTQGRARAHARLELERARKAADRLELTEAQALALGRKFITDRKNWKAIEVVATAIDTHAAQLAELKRWHNREVRILVEIADGRSDWSAIVPHQEWAAGEVAGFIELGKRA